MIFDRDDKFATKMSLCWHCSRATDSTCSWSRDFVPVDGLVAEEHEMKYTHKISDVSYQVKWCPKFARYEYKGEISEQGAKALAGAVMAAAGRDYLKWLTKEKKQRDADKGLFTKRTLYKDNGCGEKDLFVSLKHLYGFEPLNQEIPTIERWFQSEDALLFGITLDPVYLMETIQKEVGIYD